MRCCCAIKALRLATPLANHDETLTLKLPCVRETAETGMREGGLAGVAGETGGKHMVFAWLRRGAEGYESYVREGVTALN